MKIRKMTATFGRLDRAELGLEDMAGKAVRTYSGGMKRRLALARALLAPGDALMLDEPFAGLDADSRGRAVGAIRRAAAGKPVLLVTHDPADALALDAGTVELECPEISNHP